MFNRLWACKHEFKEAVDMEIIDYAKISNVFDVNTGKETVICSGKYKVYRCLDCKCLVWEEI